MVAILFVVITDRGSQEAYRLLMNTSIKFKPLAIKGKNLAERLKRDYKIDQVPTLFITSKKKKYVGVAAIKSLIDRIEDHYYQQHIQNPGGLVQNNSQLVKNEELVESTESSSQGPPKIPRRDDSEESKYEESLKDEEPIDEDMPVTNPAQLKKLAANKKKVEPIKEEEDDEEILEF